MKRRDFLRGSIVGATALGTVGCSTFGTRHRIKPKIAPFSVKVAVPKPKGGTMPTSEIGKTGIRVSRFGFGSHMRNDALKYTKEREKMIREAYDLGVTVFDVYEKDFDLFQYGPMGKYLAPMIKDVVLSAKIVPCEGRTYEQEFERALKLFGRDYIDMVRLYVQDPKSPDWDDWGKLVKFKEKGYVRAIGTPTHDLKELDILFANNIPLDYVLFPYNFYHNICWYGDKPEDFSNLPNILRAKGIGVVTMKPFTGDWLVEPLNKVAKRIVKNKEVGFPLAALRYIINSGINADTTFAAMYNVSHVYEDVQAYYNPKMTDEERDLLDKVRAYAEESAQGLLPEHYKWMGKWAGKSYHSRNRIV
jgi:predicted aldo/keto reductase-like oxidoreductase